MTRYGDPATLALLALARAGDVAAQGRAADAIRAALTATQGSRAAAARALGISADSLGRALAETWAKAVAAEIPATTGRAKHKPRRRVTRARR